MLGSLAEKFPALANAVVTVLREFLVHPSPVLDRLSRHSDVFSKPKSSLRQNLVKTQSIDKQERQASQHKTAVVNKITNAFQQLRDVAMKNVCMLV